MGRNQGPKGRPEARVGLPEQGWRGNRMQELRQDSFGLEKGACRAYLWVMTMHFPFQNSYAALPASFFARVAPRRWLPPG